MIDFPASPTNGQQFTAAGVTWTWDGAKWAASGLSVAYLPLAGGTMSGPIVLAADPAAAMNPVTLQYLNARPMIGDNRIINGDFRVDQRNNGASFTAINGNYTIDRWCYLSSGSGMVTCGRNLNGIAGPLGFPYYIGFQSLVALSITPSVYTLIAQPIEADMIGDLAWGTAQAQPVTLSFWARSSLTGTFGGYLVGAQYYPFTFSLPTANTWTKIVLAIPGCTGGSWTLTGNGNALDVEFYFAGGAGTGLPPNNAWTASYVAQGPAGIVSIVAAVGATFYVTGVKLEVGSVATPYNRQSLAKSLADCQRYYCTGALVSGGTMTAGQTMYAPYSLPVSMRVGPTIVITNNSSGNISSPAINPLAGGRDLYAQGVAVATGGTNFNFTFTASAELSP